MQYRSFKLFYGWWIVGACFIISFLVAGTVFYGFTAFIDPIASSTGWNYTQISLASSIRGLETSLLAPLVGFLADRYGPKRLIFFGAIFLASGLILLSRTNSLGIYYASFILIAIGTSGFTSTVMMTTVANWFHKNIGLASGIVSCGAGFGGFLIPILVLMIDTYGWRPTLVIIAIFTLVFILPLSLIIRHKPEQYGYVPDGQRDNSNNNYSNSIPITDNQITAKQAFGTGTFWLLTVAYAMFMIIINAVLTHIMPYLNSINISRSNSALIATAIPLFSIGGRLSLGWLGDKKEKRVVTALAFAAISGGILCLALAANLGINMLILFLFLFGFSYGGCITLRTTLIREYFGRKNFGTIFGTLMGITTISGALIGPTLAGWTYDNWISYQPIWFIFSALPLISLVCVLSIKPVKT